MIVVITGISRGIGKATIQRALNLGYECIGLTRSETNIDPSLIENSNAHIIKVNWSDPIKIVEMITMILKGRCIDVLINNAATIKVVDLNDTDLDTMMNQFRVNAILPFLLSKELLHANAFARGAHIVNIGSMAGYQDSAKFPGLGAYSASKAALACLTQSMAAEWGDQLSINCLCLGAVDTDMLKAAFPDYQAKISDVQMASYIMHFAASAPELINGQVISVKKDDPR